MLDVDFVAVEFRVPEDRWDALMASVGRALSAHNGRVVARSLASITATVLSMHLSWGLVTQLYTRHLYALINSVWTLNCLVVLTEGAINELLFWKGLLIHTQVRGPDLPADWRRIDSDGVGRERLRLGRTHHARRYRVLA